MAEVDEKLEGLGKGQEAQGGSSPCEAGILERWSRERRRAGTGIRKQIEHIHGDNERQAGLTENRAEEEERSTNREEGGRNTLSSAPFLVGKEHEGDRAATRICPYLL